jgi:coenzyme F420-reducing hydrogenase beta subunit
MNKPSMKSVIAAHAQRLHAIDGVVSVAEGSDEGKPCILVFLTKDDAVARERILAELEGHPVQIIISGEPTLHDE